MSGAASLPVWLFADAGASWTNGSTTPIRLWSAIVPFGVSVATSGSKLAAEELFPATIAFCNVIVPDVDR